MLVVSLGIGIAAATVDAIPPPATFLRAFGGAGSGAGNLSAPIDTATDSEGNVWVADVGHNRVQEFNSKGEFLQQFGATGTGNGQFTQMHALAFDAKGNLWVAAANRVQEFNSKGEYIRQFGSVGSGNGQFFEGLTGLAADPEGHLWTLESSNEFTGKARLQEFTSEGVYLAKFEYAIGKEAGQLKNPQALAIDPGGNFWIADTGNHRVEEFNAKGEFLRASGSEGTGNGQFKSPRGIATDAAGNFWVADTGNNRIESFSSAGVYLAQFGKSGNNAGQFSEPKGLTVDAAGNIWVADSANDRVEEVAAGAYVRQFGGAGSGAGNLSAPIDTATDSEGNVWVADVGHNRVQEFNSKGEFLQQFGATGTGNGQFTQMHALAFDAKGNLWVAAANRVQEFNSKGEYIRQFGSVGEGSGQFYGLAGIAVDPEGHVWTLEGETFFKPRLQEFSTEGVYLARFEITEGKEAGQLKAPQALAIDPSGNFWVADTGNHRVEEFSAKGEFLRASGSEGNASGQFKNPKGIATDAAGDVWVADTGNNRIEAFSSTGEYLEQVGSGGNGNGEIAEPRGIVLDSSGHLWVADTGNNRVEEWSYTGKASATTESATGLKASQATLKGMVNPGGLATTYHFEYGASTSYGTSVPVPSGALAATIADLSVSQAINGLAEGTTYHFRLVAESSAGTAVGQDMIFTTPQLPEATTESATSVKAASASLQATINPKGLSTTYLFEYGTSAQYGSSIAGLGPVSGTSNVKVSRAISGLQETTTYHYRVAATSSAGTVKGQDKTFTTESFPETTITSSHPSYTAHEIASVAFASSKPSSTFKCSLDRADGKAITPCSSPFSLPKGLSAGSHTFVVAAVDSAGNADPTPARWTFNTDIWPPAPASSKITSPEAGKKTGSYYTLQAAWDPSTNVSGIGFQMKLPGWEAFKEVPAECVLDGVGKQVIWPLAVQGSAGHSEPVFLGVRDCPLFAGSGFPEKDIQFRAVFDGSGGVAGASEPVSTEFLRLHNATRVPTDATETIGPASLDLVTGAFTITRTDVSIPVPGTEATLEFTRTYDSTLSTDVKGFSSVLGGIWQPSTPMESEYAGEAWTQLKEQVIEATPAVTKKECWDPETGKLVECGSGCPEESCDEYLEEEAQPEMRWMELIDNSGAGIPFEISGSSYISPDYAKELKLIWEDPEHITLSDPNGTHTTFMQKAPGEYLPKTISFQASPSSARMVYEPVGGYEHLRLIREIAAAPGVECQDTASVNEAGCRTLAFEYLHSGTWGGGSYLPSDLKLASIRYYNASGNSASSQKVSEYNYRENAFGELRLSEEWILGSPRP